ncbi:MAG TPA: hypothetical protein VK117_05320 [Pyrinomonadaceae bacterium]|nr:hypothetical protein [Pyrinomonadaceae bacterium]
MKLNHARNSLIVVLVLLALPIVISAQNRKPRLRRPAPRVVAPVLVPVGTNLKVRLNETLSSKESRAGDKFTAAVLDPVRFNEATVHGHIRSILKSGKVTGRTTMNLAFDSIDLTDNRHGVVHGYVTKVYGSNGTTDQEGGVQSSGRGNQTLKRSGIGAAAGAIIGGIAGGGKGAAIGLILGGAGGAGSLAIKGSKELKLESGTEMLVHVTR